ncbi:Histone chaperone asf1 [Hypoxylon texense]
MHHPSGVENGLPAEIVQLIFENLVGDTKTLADVGLVCRSWRALSLRFLLQDVDLSSHNMGRLPEYEQYSFRFFREVVMADYSDQYRPHNLVPRQRAFLRLMTDRPELAVHVKALTWTLVWLDFEETELTDIDLRTWDVFGRMQNVARLDLASLHDVSYQPYIRQNPARLFPAVTDLRLVGWMHRGLVKAILTSLDASKLSCLKLDHLQDEGALPNGEPMPMDIVANYSYHQVDPYVDEGIDEKLWARQERGDAGIFPGPMWYPLRFLRQRRLASMAHLEIRLGPFTENLDLRNDVTMFREIAEFIRSAKDTLETISIGLGEHPALHDDGEGGTHQCGTARIRFLHIFRPLYFDLTSAFLHRLLPALTEERFPRLTQVNLKGFRIIRDGTSLLAVPPDPDLTWEFIRNCPFVEEGFTETANVDYRQPFSGYDYYPDMDKDKIDELDAIMEES